MIWGSGCCVCVFVCVCVCVCIRENFLCFWQGGWEKIISVQLRIEVILKLSLGPLENYIFQLTFYLEYSLSESQMEIWPLLGSPSAELKLQCLFFLTLWSATSSPQILSAQHPSHCFHIGSYIWEKCLDLLTQATSLNVNTFFLLYVTAA